MQIQINTDNHFKGHETLTEHINSKIVSALSRMSEHITRLEVHLSDENGDKSSKNDKRCMIEARLEKRQPIAVTHHDSTLDKSVDGALDKLMKVIESTLDKERDQQRRRTEIVPAEPQIPEAE